MSGHVRPVLAATLASALLLAGCTGHPAPKPSAPNLTGGLYRTEIEDFGFTGAFDPAGEYSQLGIGLLSQLLVRTLVTYRHVSGAAGIQVVPDLATTTGAVSNDGLTWTFMLKKGVRWGPPVSRSITSADVAYAFRRIDNRRLVAQYGFLYDGLIDGLDGLAKVTPSRISGIDTPNDRTIVFHLRRPAGDFPGRLAMPAAAPMPPEVAGCFSKPGDYGRDVVSSGPYMIAGSAGVRSVSCSTVRPVSGFDPTKFMRFVRNPNYDPKTDSPIDRSAYVNGVDIEIDSNTDQILQGVATGRLDGSLLVTPNPSVVGPKPAVRTDPVDSLVYLSLNLLKPPFNDVHVRRAVGLLLNRTALTSVVGGAQPGTPASGIVPPILLGVNDGAPVTGNVAMARAEMARSRYDLDKNGRCDAPVCRAVRYMSTGRLVLTTTLQSELASIGIELKLVEYDGSSFVFPPPFEFPLSVRRLNADYADPATFFELLQSRGIDCFGGGNPSFVGMTRAQAATCNRLPTYDGAAHPTPSLDGRIAACEAMTGAPRTACWGELDRFVTNDLAAWVPLLWPSQPTAVGRTVVRYVFDVSTGMISLCQIAVSNHATMPAS